MPVPFWAGHYIGLPFRDHGRDRSGIDCWGLVRLVMAEQFGIALPSLAHEYAHTAEKNRIGPLIERESDNFTPLPAAAEKLGDIIVLRLHGQPMHVGLVLGDGQMLHVEDGIDSSVARYRGPRWQDRIFGFYRYEPF
ncbi:MAG: NlpC/P60 family protein [Micavibrio sp.]|nr:NlpC/P60 family protein [Micavibrio sp.]